MSNIPDKSSETQRGKHTPTEHGFYWVKLTNESDCQVVLVTGLEVLFAGLNSRLKLSEFGTHYPNARWGSRLEQNIDFGLKGGASC